MPDRPRPDPRMDPLPEEEWDDEVVELINVNWSGDPPGNRNNLYRTMVRHRDLFRVWNEFGRYVFNCVLPRPDRQLLVLRTAWRTQCQFEWSFHAPLALNLGFAREDLDRITKGPDADGWEPYESLLIRAADELHESSVLTAPTWDALRARYNDEELIEIPVIVGQYHLVAYLTNSLRIAPPPELPMLPSNYPPPL